MEKVWVMMLATLMASSTMMAGNVKKSTTYFMAQIDGCEPFKVGFNAERDSVVTLATALPRGVYHAKVIRILPFRFQFPERRLGYGASWHPSMLQHRKMAAELLPFLRKLMNWN